MGHSDAPNELLPALSAEIERHITEYDVKEFLVGHYGSFDSLAAKALADAKKRHPKVDAYTAASLSSGRADS